MTILLFFAVVDAKLELTVKLLPSLFKEDCSEIFAETSEVLLLAFLFATVVLENLQIDDTIAERLKMVTQCKMRLYIVKQK